MNVPSLAQSAAPVQSQDMLAGRSRIILGGVSLVTPTLRFAGVFSYLASHMRRSSLTQALAYAFCAVLYLLASCPARAQQPTRVYLPNPADEDWSFLKDQTKRIDPWDRLKYIPLGKDDSYLTLSGEFRYR